MRQFALDVYLGSSLLSKCITICLCGLLLFLFLICQDNLMQLVSDHGEGVASGPWQRGVQ